MLSFTSNIRSRLGFLTKPFPRDALRAGAGYLRRNPSEIFTLARNAAGLKLTMPLDALRWLLDNLPSSPRAPRDVAIGAAPPSISVGLTSELMGNPFRMTSDVTVEEVRASTDELVLVLRVSNLDLKALGAQDSPMANLFRAMDFSDPGQLMNMMPHRSPALVEARKDRIVLDLLKVPKIAASPVVRKALEIVTPLLSITDIRTEADHLVVALKTRAGGLSSALAALRR